MHEVIWQKAKQTNNHDPVAVLEYVVAYRRE